MNNLLLQQTGGFPLETDTLNYMQGAYQFLQTIAKLGGENYILSGCVVAGANVGDGVLVVAGEVIEFRGGIQTTNIVIREEKQTRPFENGQVKDVFVTRYATFGTGTGAIAWSTFTRFKSLLEFRNLPTETSDAIDLDDSTKLATAKAVKLLNDKVESKLPAGCILIWSGSVGAIPNGFALCDGALGRPDLRNKFVLGAGNAYAVGSVGGEKDHFLTINEMPEHDHDVIFDASGSGNNNLPGAGQLYMAGILANSGGVRSKKTAKTGADYAHNNMPPYYALAYIIKL